MTTSPYGPCPNCESNEIIRVPGTTTRAPHVDVGLRALPIAQMICLNCGFVRQWIDDRGHLDVLRKKFGGQLPPG